MIQHEETLCGLEDRVAAVTGGSSRIGFATVRLFAQLGAAASKGIPLGRLGRKKEAAQAIVFLASPLASYMTGSFIDVSEGLSRHV
jgi:NAD(P)-dependent dehydrogenase (short-subunit alcohol dehydrogenase family)